jgi:hypothetical protein
MFPLPGAPAVHEQDARQVGIRTCERGFTGRIAFPRERRSGMKIRFGSLTVAGAVPDSLIEELHRLPVSPAGHADRRTPERGAQSAPDRGLTQERNVSIMCGMDTDHLAQEFIDRTLPLDRAL